MYADNTCRYARKMASYLVNNTVFMQFVLSISKIAECNSLQIKSKIIQQLTNTQFLGR